jgi:hypothetical protein
MKMKIVIPECDNIIIFDEKIFEQIFYNGINKINICNLSFDNIIMMNITDSIK